MKHDDLSIVSQGESDTMEFKESFKDDALETIGAFANTRGGVLLIGLNDQGHPVGVTVGKATLREITSRISACTEPRVVPDIRVETMQDRSVVVIEVPEYPIKPVSVRGRCYRRVGDSNRQMPPAEIAQMHMASTGSSWDALPARGKAVADVDLDLVCRYMTQSTNVGRRDFLKGADPVEVMRKLELLADGNSPTWAAVLLFGKRPQSPLVQARVHCGRFRTETDIADDRLIEGSLLEQIEETIGFLKKHINVRFVITGKPRREQIWDYPLEALREAVINAICHRDYADSADIQIKVFDDHIRIWSPGLLPYGLTVEDLRRRSHASKPRNKLIAQVFYDLEVIERYGSGIHRMLDACAAAGLPEPSLEECTGGFLMTFRKTAEVADIAAGQDIKESEKQLAAHVAMLEREFAAATGQATGQVTGQVAGQVLQFCQHAQPAKKIQKLLNLNHRETFLNNYLKPLLRSGWLEPTIPDKPRSSRQMYRLTERGRAVLALIKKPEQPK
ncbi:MAG: helix-turn-helix domain-containing protein [Kiritimatiellae bacterium]|nr:helix-turn-helix domain-containing protein [Kiritimatiellia bacterium]MDD4026008.1 helix-turn-helix domain-containing protein [Kiritimatiellia bacterium]